MDKPFSIIYEEFKQNLANLINESGLPMPIMESVLQNFLYELNGIAKSQYQADKIQYEKSLLNENKNNKNEEKK